MAREECRRGAHLPVYAVSPQLDKPLKSVTHGQCDFRPTVTLPAAGHHRPLTGTKLYCLVTDTCVCVCACVRACVRACVCEQLAQGWYLKAQRPGIEPAAFGAASPTP